METDGKIRADVALVARGLAASRERAQELINGGLVTLNGKALEKCSVRIAESDDLAVLGTVHPYVSRGGLKLARALESFDVKLAGRVCMDVGASTGGFTDVLLQNGAAKVYAIDVGAGQLDPQLQADQRVISMEHTNARALRPDLFDEMPTLGVMDVSFISITLILPAAFAILGESGQMISLIKPQFEAGPKKLGKKGIVSDPRVHIEVLEQIVRFAPTLGWRVRALDHSPIAGTAGNLEFLADFVPASRGDRSPSPEEIRALVRTAHNRLRR